MTEEQPVRLDLPIPPATLANQPTIADLNHLLARMKDAAEHMGADNSHRALLNEAGWWLVQLANELLPLKDAALKAQMERRIILPGE